MIAAQVRRVLSTASRRSVCVAQPCFFGVFCHIIFVVCAGASLRLEHRPLYTRPRYWRLVSSEHMDEEARAASVREDAKALLDGIQDGVASRDATMRYADSVLANAHSFEDQWEAFKKKFDRLTSLALSNLGGMMGVPTGSVRPAELISEERIAQVLRKAKHVVVLTGAGISAESGIPTFRGADGYWTIGSENYQPQELATWEKFNEMPEELWRWYQYRWGVCLKAKPNPGHRALVKMEGLLGDSFTLVTQNIDGLHLQAGSKPQHLCEIHGRIDEMRCDERIEGSCLFGLNLDDAEVLDKARRTVEKTPQPAKKEKDERLPVCRTCVGR